MAKTGLGSPAAIGAQELALREELISLIKRWTSATNDVVTAVPGLTLYKRLAPVSEACDFYLPGLALIVQGSKEVSIGGDRFTYGEATFLLTSVELPTINRVVKASRERPYLAAVLHLDLLTATELVARYDLHHRSGSELQRAIGTGPATREVMDAFRRLLALLDKPDEIPFLAELIHRELLYRLLQTADGSRLRATVAADSAMNRVTRAIAWIRAHYCEPLLMSELAAVTHMAVSTLHHNFRMVTAMSPLQYQKQLRLHEARKLLALSGLDVAGAAAKVGYESVNQFSREYSRLFGNNPKQDRDSGGPQRGRLHRPLGR